MSSIRSLYRTLIPESLRWKILRIKQRKKDNELKNAIINYYDSHPAKDSEIIEAIDYLRKNSISVFPYNFFLEYKNKPIEVKIDPACQLPYVMHCNKKLYFKKSWSTERIVDAYRFLLAEQDKRSAHCYLSETYAISPNSVVVDVGSAEGIFALHEIENIKHIYLVETDLEWIEAVNETYKPWIEKVTIINKFVSDKDDEHNLRLDTYFQDINRIDFMKIDVDGAEQSLINGADKTISAKVDKLAICTYHNANDNDDFTKYFKNKNYNVENSQGYMLFYFDPNFEAPYFRRGLIKARKIN